MSDAHRRPQPLWCIDLWNHVDARRKTVLGHVVKRERGRGTLVLAASAVRGRCPVYALGAAGLYGTMYSSDLESLNAENIHTIQVTF